jgi:hypothetical protein
VTAESAYKEPVWAGVSFVDERDEIRCPKLSAQQCFAGKPVFTGTGFFTSDEQTAALFTSASDFHDVWNFHGPFNLNDASTHLNDLDAAAPHSKGRIYAPLILSEGAESSPYLWLGDASNCFRAFQHFAAVNAKCLESRFLHWIFRRNTQLCSAVPKQPDLFHRYE